MASSELEIRAREDANLNSIVADFANPLGDGTDGSVWPTNRKTAVKALQRQRNYRCERDCYQRLKEHQITVIDGLAVPRLVSHDDVLWIIEMDIVSPPFLLDFAKAYLDVPPDHTAEVIEDWRQAQAELWEDRWPQVRSILWQLERLGIYYQDPKPGNIMFADWQK